MEREEKICLFIIFIIVIAIVSYFGYNYFKTRSETQAAEEARSKLFVEEGDVITYEVTAWLDNGQIFYTTEKSIDEDDSNLKTPNYQFFSDDPLVSTAGAELVSKFNVGFNENVLNMRIDQKETFRVTPDKAYNWPNESLIKNIPKNDMIPLYEKMPTEMFQNAYNPTGSPLFIGQQYIHIYWLWPIELTEVNNETITYRHTPSIGDEIEILPWPAEVTGFSEKDEKLFIKHKIDNDLIFTTVDPIELLDYDPNYINIQTIQSDIGIGTVPGVIVTHNNDYFTIDFNDERAGTNIWYEVTILDIEKA